MATARALSVALLLAFCFVACACAPATRHPTNRYISYAGVPHGRGGNRQDVSALTGKHHQAPGSVPAPTKVSATKAAVGSKGSHAALSRDTRPAPTKAGAKGAYISHAALSRDKLCGRLGCPSRP